MVKRLVIELPDETHRQLKQAALDRNTNMRVIFLALIADFLSKIPKKAKK